jgi:mannosyltransferase
MSKALVVIQSLNVRVNNYQLTKKSTLLILATIVCLAGVVRWYQIGAQSLWTDELFSASYAKMNLSNLILVLKSDLNPPFYFLLLHYWVKLFGYSESALRAMSFIFGIFSIPMIYIVAKELFAPMTGLLSALILSLSTFHIYFSQEARSYSLMGLLTLVSFYFFLKLIKKEPTKLDLIGFILINSILLYTHSACVFIIIAQNAIWLVLKFFKRISQSYFRWFLYQFLSLLFFSPWLVIELHQFQFLQKMNVYGIPTLYGLANTFYQYAGSFFLLFLFFLIFSLGLYSRSRRNNPNELLPIRWAPVFLSMWVGLPILVPFILSQFISPVFTSRNTLGAAFGFYILIAKSLAAIKYIMIAVVLFCVILLASAQNLLSYYTVPNKEQWREAVNYVEGVAHSGDMISIIAPPYAYYNKRSDLVRVEDLSVSEGKSKLSLASQIWIIRSPGDDPSIFQMIKGRYILKQNQDFFRVSVSLYTANQ